MNLQSYFRLDSKVTKLSNLRFTSLKGPKAMKLLRYGTCTTKKRFKIHEPA